MRSLLAKRGVVTRFDLDFFFWKRVAAKIFFLNSLESTISNNYYMNGKVHCLDSVFAVHFVDP